MKSKLIETIIIILFIGILLCLPHPGEAQYGPFYYPASSWGNPGLFQFPAYAPNYPMAGFAGGYGSLGGISPYAPYGSSLGGYSPYGAAYSPYGAAYNTPYLYSYNSPPPPLPVGDIETVRAMEAKGIYLYYIFEDAYSNGVTVSKPEVSLRIADVSDPENPDVVKSVSLDYPVSDIFIHGDYLYWFSDSHLWDIGYSINEDEYLLGVFDISNPVSPTKLDTLELNISLQGAPTFSFHEDRLYILCRQPAEDDDAHKLVTIDIFDPGDLSRLSTGEIDLDRAVIHDMTVRDNLAFLSNGYIMDISDPGHPSLVCEVDDNGSHLGRHALFGNYLLLVAEEEGLWIMDIQDPSQPELITTVELSWPDEIIVKGNLAYISDRCKGLNVVNLADPENPQLLSGYRLPSHKMYRSTSNSSEGWLNDMDIGEGLAFTLSFSNIQIWDITQAGNVELAEKIDSDHEVMDLTESVIPGELVLFLSMDTIDIISLGKDGGIATFGIDSLDALNQKFGVSKITKETSSHDVPALISDLAQYSKRTYTVEFPESVDMFDIWDAYMDNPYCLIAEFRYTSNFNSYDVVWSPAAGYGLPFLGGNVYGGAYGLGYGSFNPYGYAGIPFQGSNLFQSPYGILGAGYSPYGPINPFQFGSGIPGLFNSTTWSPLSSLFPGGNLQLTNPSYWPGSTYPGTNTYNPIYNPYGYGQSYYQTPVFSQGAYIGRNVNGQFYPSSLSYEQIYAGGGPTFEQIYFPRVLY